MVSSWRKAFYSDSTCSWVSLLTLQALHLLSLCLFLKLSFTSNIRVLVLHIMLASFRVRFMICTFGSPCYNGLIWLSRRYLVLDLLLLLASMFTMKPSVILLFIVRLACSLVPCRSSGVIWNLFIAFWVWCFHPNLVPSSSIFLSDAVRVHIQPFFHVNSVPDTYVFSV